MRVREQQPLASAASRLVGAPAAAHLGVRVRVRAMVRVMVRVRVRVRVGVRLRVRVRVQGLGWVRRTSASSSAPASRLVSNCDMSVPPGVGQAQGYA